MNRKPASGLSSPSQAQTQVRQQSQVQQQTQLQQQTRSRPAPPVKIAPSIGRPSGGPPRRRQEHSDPEQSDDSSSSPSSSSSSKPVPIPPPPGTTAEPEKKIKPVKLVSSKSTSFGTFSPKIKPVQNKPLPVHNIPYFAPRDSTAYSGGTLHLKKGATQATVELKYDLMKYLTPGVDYKLQGGKIVLLKNIKIN